MHLTTERLTFRQRTPDDFDALHAMVSDFEVIKWTATWPWPADPAFTRERTHPIPADRGLSGMVCLESTPIGMLSVIDGELGYLFDRRHWGRGYATEIGRAVVNEVFRTTNADRLTAGLFDGNEGSARVLEKIGFVQTGRGTLLCRAQGRELAGPDYALTRAAWAAHPRPR